MAQRKQEKWDSASKKNQGQKDREIKRQGKNIYFLQVTWGIQLKSSKAAQGPDFTDWHVSEDKFRRDKKLSEIYGCNVVHNIYSSLWGILGHEQCSDIHNVIFSY